MCRVSMPLGWVGVPLNSICSTQCEIPVSPGISLRLPTRYHTQNVATGTVRCSASRISRPLSSVSARIVDIEVLLPHSLLITSDPTGEFRSGQGPDAEHQEDMRVSMDRPSWREVARYRADILARHRVRTKRAALAFVNSLGFCYAFTSGPGGLPGLFDVLATRSIDRMWTWAWQWKDELATEKKLFYGKVIRRKPTYVSLRFVPHFFTLTGNVGDADDYLQAYREGRLSLLAREIYEHVREHGPCSTWVLRKQFVSGASRGAAFHRALSDLQGRFLISNVGERERGSYSFIWDTFARWRAQAVRAYGIHSAMPLRTAFNRCPHAVFLPVDFSAYGAASRQIMAILHEYSSLVEPLSLDEAFLDVSSRPEVPRALAEEIRRRIKGDTGLTASIGIGPNKLLAKVASGLHKPDAVTEITPDKTTAVLPDLPAPVLWGVGPKTAARLEQTLGVRTVGDLQRIPLAQLQELLGPRWGEDLYRTCRGEDDSPIVTDW